MFTLEPLDSDKPYVASFEFENLKGVVVGYNLPTDSGNLTLVRVIDNGSINFLYGEDSEYVDIPGFSVLADYLRSQTKKHKYYLSKKIICMRQFTRINLAKRRILEQEKIIQDSTQIITDTVSSNT